MIDLWNKLPLNPTKKFKTRRLFQLEYIIVHAISAENWTPQKLNALCTGVDATPDDFTDDLKDMRNEPTCSYHDYIRADGTLYHIVDYHIRTWHVGNWNTKCIGVALEYKPKLNKGPSEAMMATLKNYLAMACLYLSIDPRKIRGHRELEGTGWYLRKGKKVLRKTCPGMKIDLSLLRDDVMGMIEGIEEITSKDSIKPFLRFT